ncbi:MAG TPA: hypothetical protein VNQ90_08305 [Chthoniobacteraceae bacterium]|nr:hypothetical protein [Chthoniobacteraceae bacterium]
MKINNVVPGLPEWPPIRFQPKTGKFTIKVTHAGFFRYDMIRWLMKLLVFGIIFMLCFSLYRYYAGKPIPVPFDRAMAVIIGKDGSNVIHNFIVIIFGILFLYGILSLMQIPRILSRLLFPKRTKVIFTPKTIEFNGQRFDTANGMPILFQTENSPLSEDYHASVQRKIAQRGGQAYLTYPLKFRNIEMVYGSRLVKIADLPGPQRAQAFAIALQETLRMSKNLPPELRNR